MKSSIIYLFMSPLTGTVLKAAGIETKSTTGTKYWESILSYMS